MSAPELVMFAVVLLVGFPAAWRNWTAAALVVSYLLVQGMWAAGVVLGLGSLFMVDITVVALIYCKALSRCKRVKYDGFWHQLRCVVLELSPCDRAIVGIFVFVTWPGYVAAIPAFHKWWLLYLAALAQYLLAGLESYLEWRRDRARVIEPDNPSSGSLRIAWAGSGQWST